MGEYRLKTLIIALAFRNGFEYRNADRFNSANDRYISRKNLVNFGPVTPNITRYCELLRIMVKIVIPNQISQILLDR